MDLEHVYQITMTFEHEDSGKDQRCLVFSVLPEDAGTFADFMTFLENTGKKENWYSVKIESISKTYLD